MVTSFWRGKKVFLTGHTGFKGSWLSLWLTQLGAEVTGYALEAKTHPSLFKLAHLEKDMHSVYGDIRDLETLRSSMTKANPEIIIHMAAQPLVRASYVDPVETYSTNVMGTVNVHEAARSLKNLKSLVNVTTDKCYENKERTWGYSEDEALGGYDPYSNSKACSELVSSAYRQSFHLPVATARAGNVIGGGDWATDRLLPDIFRSLEQQQEITIRNPNAIRPWQHVMEPLSGYLLLAQKVFENTKDYTTSFNFGPDSEDVQNVETITKTLVSLWGKGARYKITENGGPHEATFLMLNCDKAKRILKWAPKWKLSQVLPKITHWYQSVQKDPTLARAITLAEIQEYELS